VPVACKVMKTQSLVLQLISPINNIPAITPCTQQVSLPLVTVRSTSCSLQNSKMESEAHLSLKKCLWIPSSNTFKTSCSVLLKPNKKLFYKLKFWSSFDTHGFICNNLTCESYKRNSSVVPPNSQSMCLQCCFLSVRKMLYYMVFYIELPN